MFDITTLSAAETSTVELLGGDDAPLYDDKGKPLSITVYGPGTKVYQRAQARQVRRHARQRQPQPAKPADGQDQEAREDGPER